MNEAEWATALDPIKMLHAKGLPIPLDEVSTARWRFFYSACLRLLWSSLSVEDRRAIEAAEDFSLGMVSADQLDQFIPDQIRNRSLNDNNYWFQLNWATVSPTISTPASVAVSPLQPMIWRMVYVTDFEKVNPLHQSGYSADRAHEFLRTVQMSLASQRAGPAPTDASDPEHTWHAAFMSVIHDVNLLAADLLRCVVGNPFRTINMAPHWQSNTVDGLLRGIRQEKAYDRLPILADALEEAGCEEQYLLNHCRYQGRHCIGCWAAHLPSRPAQSKAATSWFG